MSLSATLPGVLKQNHELLQKHLADLSDADLMHRPFPVANHAAWQLLHAVSFVGMVQKMIDPDDVTSHALLPERYAKSYGDEASRSDDPALFPKKDELLELSRHATDALCATLAKAGDDALQKPTPAKWQAFAPTLAHLATVVATHAAMHLGQVQMIRRALGKPRVF